MAINTTLDLRYGNEISDTIEVGVFGLLTLTGYGEVKDIDTQYHWLCYVEKQMTNGMWAKLYELTPTNNIVTIFGEGIYRVCRISGKCLVDSAISNQFVDFYSFAWSAGSLDGFDLINNLNGTVNIGPGLAVLRDDNYESANLLTVEFDGIDNLELNNNEANYISLNYNDGNPEILLGDSLGSFNDINNTILYIAYRDGNEISYIDQRNQNVDPNRKHRRMLYETETFRRVIGGSVLGVKGTRNIHISAGAFYYGLNKTNHPEIDTTTTGKFSYTYSDGSGDWNTSLETQYSVTHYDNLSGTPEPIPVGHYCSHWVYIVNNTPSFALVQVGQNTYDNLEEATGEQPPTPPHITDSLGILIGRILIQQGNDEPVRVDSAFTEHYTYAHSRNHNEASNIQGGSFNERYHLDHTQWERYDRLIESPDDSEEEDVLTFINGEWKAVKPLQNLLVLNIDKVHGVTTEEVTLNGDVITLTDLEGTPLVLTNNDVIQVSHQTNPEENGLYRAKLSADWELLYTAEELAKNIVLCDPNCIFEPATANLFGSTTVLVVSYDRVANPVSAFEIQMGLQDVTQQEIEDGNEVEARLFSPEDIKNAILYHSPPPTPEILGNVVLGSNTKNTLVSADLFSIADSEDDYILKKITWANLLTNFGSLAQKDDVPSDNKRYIRRNGAWEVFNSSGSVITLYEPIKAISSTNLTLSGISYVLTDFQANTSYTSQDGDIVYVKAQTDTSENGIYIARDAGNWDIVYSASDLNGADVCLVWSGNLLRTTDPDYREGTVLTVFDIDGLVDLASFIGDVEDDPKDNKLYARKNNKWVDIASENLGYVAGPASSTDEHIAIFNGATGKKIQDSGYKISDLIGGGGTASVGGNDKELQYNDDGDLNGIPNLIFNNTLGLLRLGAFDEKILDLGTIGEADTINLDVSLYNNFVLTLGSTNVELNFINGIRQSPSPTLDLMKSIIVVVKQGGDYHPTWPVNVKWNGGLPPTYSQTVGKYDVYSFFSFNIGNPDEFWFGTQIVSGA